MSIRDAKALSQLLLLKQRGFSFLARTRKFSSSKTRHEWRKESPTGGLTEVYTFTPDSQTVWPDPTLGVFSNIDHRFTFPGNVGFCFGHDGPEERPCNDAATKDNSNIKKISKIDILEVKTTREHQAQTMYTAHDFIHYSEEASAYVCSEPVLLETFPCPNMEEVRFELHEAPTLLKKELISLFPGIDAFQNQNHSVSIITMALNTRHDMSIWSNEVEEEREAHINEFYCLAKEICGRFKSDGYWADFIDPSTGVPYFGNQTNTTMCETDDKYRLLGFRIEDLGCCKVICHRDFGRKVFVGTLFTTVTNQNFIQDIFHELNISNLVAFQSNRSTSTISPKEFNL